jgi:two-component system cell cycle response regulator
MGPETAIGEILSPFEASSRDTASLLEKGHCHLLPELLLPIIFSSQPPSKAQPPSVLWAYERPLSPSLRSMVHKALGPTVSLRLVPSLTMALLELSSRPFELLLTGNMLEDGDGFQLAKGIRERRIWTPVVMLTSMGDEELAARCVEEGFVAYLAGTMLRDQDRVSATFSRALQEGSRRRRMASLLAEMGEMAILDRLTSLYNRFFAEKLLALELGRCKRYGDPLCVALLDVDGFKKVNDAFGHLRGDQVLIELASLLKKTLRTTDHIGRYGGDEFLLVLPRARLVDGISLCTRIIRTVRGHVFLGNGADLEIGVSIGLTHWRGGQWLESHTILEETDKALYRAKKKGKNRICYSDQCVARVEQSRRDEALLRRIESA